ncbi:MAG TPA: RimK family alpha-L-glutamate ligase [Stellaceae bacterium]|nr:RimK family alpha-L-glutamate ligase [Stellaceae bacterium]
MTRVVIFADEPDWHCRRLLSAFEQRRATISIASLRQCRFELGADGAGMAIPGFEATLPDAALVRNIPNGSFEQVTFRLSFLHALRELGVPVVNDARAIERCVDKSMTSFLLHRARIPTPHTLVTEDSAAALSWRETTTADVVAKPLFGAQGRGLTRTAPHQPLPDVAAEPHRGVLYLQRYVGRERDWRDFRVFVVGGEAVAAMVRHGTDWVTNVARGGVCEPAPCSGTLAELAIAAAGAVGAGYCGVDLIEEESRGLMVLEVNSMPAWKGLQSVTEVDLADRIAGHVLAL